MSDYPIAHLTDAESWRVVAEGQIGRIAVVFGGQPDIFPVSYVTHKRGIYLKTGPNSRLRQETEGSRVAFEATMTHPDGFSSVVCFGIVRVVDDPDLLTTLTRAPLVEFSSDASAIWLELKPETLRGRQLHILEA